MSDFASDVLQSLRVRSSVYVIADFSAPWGMAFPQRPHVQIHLVDGGSCTVDAAATTVHAREGDLIIVPSGAPHLISDGTSGRCDDARAIVAAYRRGERPYAGDVTAVRLLSGHVELERGIGAALLRGLPDVLHVRAQPESTELQRSLLPHVQRESTADDPGGEAIVRRLVEVLFIQALRAYVRAMQPASTLLSALLDDRLSPAFRCMHERFAEPLDLAEVAASTGMSRSSFASTFRSISGITPMAYLSLWRLHKGRELLDASSRSIAQIAAAVGHESAEGFSRAFRRAYAVSPAAYRRAAR